ncbi:MAG: protein translocase subunit SecD [Patescibacteria group bacterium]|nr:protein translocase subunit SecD [Patescibacteria group bacterium]MDD4610793.1 protein translocase subunit SecD [Patescibacteria group bacterium]
MSNNILERILRPSARGRMWQVFIFIIILLIVGSLIDVGAEYNKGTDWLAKKTNNILVLPKTKDIPFRLGLDLQGGTHLVYKADVSAISQSERDSAVEGARDVIERRVNFFGVSEPVVQVDKNIAGDYQIIVELAGIKDVNQAIKMIGETPLLEFKEKNTGQRELTPEETKKIEDFNKQADQKSGEILGKLLSGGDFSALAKTYSEDETTKNNGGDLGWITADSNVDIVNIVKDFKVGQVSMDFVQISSGYELARLDDKRLKQNAFGTGEEKEAKASHLLICYKDIKGCESGLTKEEAYNKIKTIKDKATPANFKDLVKQNSTEPGAKETGGDLGWFGTGKMVKAFEDAVFAQTKGTISDIIETEFGYHLIYKQDERSIYEYKVSHIFIKTMNAVDILGANEEWKNTELTGKNLAKATVQFDPNNSSPEVSLEFDNEGAKMFEEITARNVGQQVAIFLDNYPISAPTVNEKITGGKAVISGKFNITEAKLLAQRLNEGALPVPINLASQQTVGASLGSKSVFDSLKAGIYGFILVALFMIIFYRLPGLLSVFALGIYGILVLAIFKIWPVTLTLSGLAGFILSLGMAVDANVLIFARIREEIRSGKILSIALEDGFKRAWPSIRDSNISTLITCFILIQFSSSVVKGFAITLAIGVLVSMFSAIVITKNLLGLIMGKWLENKLWLVGVKKE